MNAGQQFQHWKIGQAGCCCIHARGRQELYARAPLPQRFSQDELLPYVEESGDSLCPRSFYGLDKTIRRSSPFCSRRTSVAVPLIAHLQRCGSRVPQLTFLDHNTHTTIRPCRGCMCFFFGEGRRCRSSCCFVVFHWRVAVRKSPTEIMGTPNSLARRPFPLRVVGSAATTSVVDFETEPFTVAPAA